MSGVHSRRKGHSFERQLAIWLRGIWPGARRQLEYHENDCRGIDIADTGRFKFQCKKLKSYASVNTIFEVQCDRDFGDVPILVTAADNKPAMAVLHLEDLIELLKKFHG